MNNDCVGFFLTPAMVRLISKLKPKYLEDLRDYLVDICEGVDVDVDSIEGDLLEVIVSEIIEAVKKSRENMERISKVRSNSGKKGAETTNRKKMEERQKSAKVGNGRQTSANIGNKDKDKDKNEYKDEREFINYNDENSPLGEVTSLGSEHQKIFHYDKPNKKFSYGDIEFKNKDIELIANELLPIANEIKNFPFWADSWCSIRSTHEMYSHKCKAARLKHILSESGFSVADYVVYLGNVAPNFDLEWSQITSVNYINGFISRKLRN